MNKQSTCLEQLKKNWAGKEKLFYCKNKTVGMNKKDWPVKPKDEKDKS